MPKKVKLFAAGVFLALVGVACVALVTASAKAERGVLRVMGSCSEPGHAPIRRSHRIRLLCATSCQIPTRIFTGKARIRYR